MSHKKDKPSSIREALNSFVDKIIDFTESEDIIATDGKTGIKLRGEDADLYLVKRRTQAQKAKSSGS